MSPAEAEPDFEEESEDPEELLDDDFNGTLEGNEEIKKLDSSIKIADEESMDGETES